MSHYFLCVSQHCFHDVHPVGLFLFIFLLKKAVLEYIYLISKVFLSLYKSDIMTTFKKETHKIENEKMV